MFEFFTETTSFMKQSAFQYKIKRAFFGKKKKKEGNIAVYSHKTREKE